jgi:hypothetical protein
MHPRAARHLAGAGALASVFSSAQCHKSSTAAPGDSSRPRARRGSAACKRLTVRKRTSSVASSWGLPSSSQPWTSAWMAGDCDRTEGMMAGATRGAGR